jgi:hypothetical protein
MLPSEGREDNAAQPGEGLAPAVAVATQTEPLRMKHRNRQLAFRSLAGGLCLVVGHGIVQHGVGILAVTGARPLR